jgi:hypothetical protein
LKIDRIVSLIQEIYSLLCSSDLEFYIGYTTIAPTTTTTTTMTNTTTTTATTTAKTNTTTLPTFKELFELLLGLEENQQVDMKTLLQSDSLSRPHQL